MFAAPRADPEIIARWEFFGIVLAGILVIDVLWELFQWWHEGRHIDKDQPPNRRK